MTWGAGLVEREDAMSLDEGEAQVTGELSVDILKEVFPAVSAESLQNPEFVKRLWQQMDNNPSLWQNLVRIYCPHSIADPAFKKAPRTLFEVPYCYFDGQLKKHQAYDTLKHFLLECFKGDFDAISRLSEELKHPLILIHGVHASAGDLKLNSFQAFFDKKIFDKLWQQNSGVDAEYEQAESVLWKTLRGELNNNLSVSANKLVTICAALVGKVSAYRRLDDDGKTQALLLAAEHAQHDTFRRMLSYGIPIETLKKILAEFCYYGKVVTVGIIFDQFEHAIDKNFRGKCLSIAVASNQLLVFKEVHKRSGLTIQADKLWLLFRSIGATLSSYKNMNANKAHTYDIYYFTPGELLYTAAALGHSADVQHLLTNAKDDIFVDEIKSALRIASANGHVNVIKTILDHPGTDLPLISKFNAAYEAGKQRQFYAVKEFVGRALLPLASIFDLPSGDVVLLGSEPSPRYDLPDPMELDKPQDIFTRASPSLLRQYDKQPTKGESEEREEKEETEKDERGVYSARSRRVIIGSTRPTS